MQCFHPITIKEWIDSSDGRKKQVNSIRYVPCGKCIGCLQMRRSQWTYRLCKEADYSDLSYFVTLTYDDDHLLNNMYQYKNVVFPIFSKRDCQLFFKKLRKRLDKFSDKTIKLSYLLVSEYGTTTFRPHYHAHLFFKNVAPDQERFIQHMIVQSWDCSTNDPCIMASNQANIHYVTKYALKDISGVFSEIEYERINGKYIGFSKEANTYLERPFMMCSTRPYIGSAMEDDLEQHISQNGANCIGVYLNGSSMPLPRVFRRKCGIQGKSIDSSGDFRINKKQYDFYRRLYDRLSTKEPFDQWLDFKIKQKEQRALDIAVRNSEKV